MVEERLIRQRIGEKVIFAQPSCRSQLACQGKMLSWKIDVNQPVLIPWIDEAELHGKILLVPELPVLMIMDCISHARRSDPCEKNDLLLRSYLMFFNNLSNVGRPELLLPLDLKSPFVAIYPLHRKVDAFLILPFIAVLVDGCIWKQAWQQIVAEILKALPMQIAEWELRVKGGGHGRCNRR